MDRQKTFQQGIHASLHAMHTMLVTAARDTHAACRDIAQGEQNAAIGAIKGALVEELDGLAKLGGDELRAQRRAKFLAIG